MSRVTAGETKEKHGTNFRRRGMGVKTSKNGSERKKGRRLKRRCDKNEEIKTERKESEGK